MKANPNPIGMQDLTDCLKSLVRPIAIIIFVVMIAVMTYEGRFDEIPMAILIATGLFGGEYSIERAVKRFKGK